MMELSLGFPLPCAGGFPQERGQAFLRLLQKQFLQAGGQVPGAPLCRGRADFCRAQSSPAVSVPCPPREWPWSCWKGRPDTSGELGSP